MKSRVLALDLLAPGFVLSPERYGTGEVHVDGIPLREIALLTKQTISPATSNNDSQYLVADTGDAFEGVLSIGRPPSASFGSTKKVLSEGDVVISRLRPYLRQVALVDRGVANSGDGVICSTEFYVLRSVDNSRIAFLVPWLLSAPVQAILAAGQEGGHHPRFNSEILMRLTVPTELCDRREIASGKIEDAVSLFRQSKLLVAEEIENVAQIARGETTP